MHTAFEPSQLTVGILQIVSFLCDETSIRDCATGLAAGRCVM